jgi:predicted ATPase
MKIITFKCKELNGYLDFDIEFNSDLTFLIGINGSGKTSVLKSTMALIAPDIDWLMTARYKNLELTITHNNNDIVIRSEKTDAGLTFLYAEGAAEQRAVLTEAQYRATLRRLDEYFHEEDGEIVRIRESRSELPPDPAFQAVRRVPNPIFLGIDRTTLPATGGSARRGWKRSIPQRRPHTALRAFLDDSVSQAEELATEAIRKALTNRERLAAKLRDDVLLTFFAEVQELGGDLLPKPRRLARYEKTRNSLKEAFRVIGIERGRVDASIDPYFQGVFAAAQKLRGVRNLDAIFSEDGNSDLQPAFYEWVEINRRLQLLSHVEELVNKFNEESAAVFREINEYVSLLGSFFSDSGKTISFKEDGSLSVMLSSQKPADVYYLSSGERQIFVLITTLMFGDPEHGSNILIIDEPELSLHLKWQDMFVGALIKADPNIQLILATHSPSIIGDRVESCIEL